MAKFGSLLPGFLLLFSYSLVGQDTIPFRLTPHNNLSVQAVLNGTDTLDLMLHTAATSLTVISAVADDLQQITWEQETEVNSWGGSSKTRFSKANVLEIKNLRWDSLPVWETARSGPQTMGKFGLNLFHGRAVEINFDEQLLILHPRLPVVAEQYEKLPLVEQNDFFFIEGTSQIGEQIFPQLFLLHSGYGGTILYDDNFVATSKIGESIKILKEKNLTDSYGNTITTKRGSLPKFFIGKTVLADLPVGFFAGAIGRQQLSVLGGDLLRRFNLIIDAQRRFIYLRPNKAIKAPFSDL